MNELFPQRPDKVPVTCSYRQFQCFPLQDEMLKPGRNGTLVCTSVTHRGDILHSEKIEPTPVEDDSDFNVIVESAQRHCLGTRIAFAADNHIEQSVIKRVDIEFGLTQLALVEQHPDASDGIIVQFIVVYLVRLWTGHGRITRVLVIFDGYLLDILLREGTRPVDFAINNQIISVIGYPQFIKIDHNTIICPNVKRKGAWISTQTPLLT